MPIENLKKHLTSLKRLESDMLEELYNLILNIPDTIIASIPSLKSPSVLIELKRMRQKLKNKMKVGEKRLMIAYSKPSTSSNNMVPESKSITSFVNGVDLSIQYGKQTVNFTKYESYNIVDSESSSTTNKLFNNHSDFKMNSTLTARPLTYNTDVYSQEHLSIHEIDCIVSDDNDDSFSVLDVQKSIQTCSINNNNFDMPSHLNIKNVSSQSSIKERNYKKSYFFFSIN